MQCVSSVTSRQANLVMAHKTISGSSQVIAQYYQLIRLGFEVSYFSSLLICNIYFLNCLCTHLPTHTHTTEENE
jgi:hypothetical protein